MTMKGVGMGLRRRIKIGKYRVVNRIFCALWVVAAAIASAGGATVDKPSSEGEGMRANSVALNGDWEFAIDNREHVETPEGAAN